MVKKNKSNFFWVSYSDLMTSLFFIVLVLFVMTFVRLKRKEKELIDQVEELDKKISLYERVQESLEPLENSEYFEYQREYERFTLSFDVKFKTGESTINSQGLDNYQTTRDSIDIAGKALYEIVSVLAREREIDTSLSKVSYLLIISGYASNTGERIQNYELSYLRALNLWKYWLDSGWDFEDPQFKGLIDLQIAGNGIGGVGRIEDPEREEENQRFIIQLVPKVGNLQD